jgi:hypothetical protein
MDTGTPVHTGFVVSSCVWATCQPEDASSEDSGVTKALEATSLWPQFEECGCMILVLS